MGASASKGLITSAIVAPASGDSGDIRRDCRYKEELKASAYPDVHTIYDAFRRGARVSGERNCMGYRPVKSVEVKEGKEVVTVGPFEWMSYKTILAKVDAIGSGLAGLNLLPANELGNRLVGIYGKNRWEWAVAQHAIFSQGAASVPLYDTLGESAAAYIIGQAGLGTVFCSKNETPKVISCKTKNGELLTNLLNIVQFEDVTPQQQAAAEAAGLTIRSFAEVEAAGKANPLPNAPPRPEDIAVICYTSGTTGNPKGAVLSHRNMVADCSAAIWAELGITQEDIHLSYLPLAHVFEQLVENALFMQGAAIGFYQGDTLKIMEDLKELRPTLFPSVPRLFNRIYDKITAKAQEAGGMKTSLFNRALEAKKYYLAKDGSLTHGLWDRIVFKKAAVNAGLDRCRLMVTGSAPLAAHVMEFMRCVFSVRMVEGYGQTECGGAATVTSVFDQGSKGHVGTPLACNEVKLVDVADMGYLHTDTLHGQEIVDGVIKNPGIACVGRGEVCYRGINIFSGYYKDAEKTAEALDADGWLHSGDIGLWDSHGNLRIIDRKKNIFKLSQGEYVAAEKIENAYLKAPLVQQVFVYGDSLHSMLVAIVVPDPDALKRLPQWEEGKSTVQSMVADPAVKQAIKDEMTKIGKGANLQGFECVKDLFLEADAWTPEDILTPTFKLKRNDAKHRYQAQIDTMYAKLDPVAGATGLRQGAV